MFKEMEPFESLDTISYLPFIVTMALSCIVLKRKRSIGRRSRFFHTSLHSAPRLGGSPSVYCHTVWYWKIRMVWKGWGYVYPFRQNTGVWQTDRQTSFHGIVRAIHTHRAVKMSIYDILFHAFKWITHIGNRPLDGHHHRRPPKAYKIITRTSTAKVHLVSPCAIFLLCHIAEQHSCTHIFALSTKYS